MIHSNGEDAGCGGKCTPLMYGRLWKKMYNFCQNFVVSRMSRLNEMLTFVFMVSHVYYLKTFSTRFYFLEIDEVDTSPIRYTSMQRRLTSIIQGTFSRDCVTNINRANTCFEKFCNLHRHWKNPSHQGKTFHGSTVYLTSLTTII